MKSSFEISKNCRRWDSLALFDAKRLNCRVIQMTALKPKFKVVGWVPVDDGHVHEVWANSPGGHFVHVELWEGKYY